MENKDCTVESLTTSQDSLTLDLSLELNNYNGQGGILEVESPFAVACSSKSDRPEQQQPSLVKYCGNRIPRLIKQPNTKSNVPLLSKSLQTEPSTKMIKNNGNNADELLKVIQSWTDDEVMNVLKRRKSLLSHQHPAKTKQCVTQPSTKKNAFFDAQNKVSACKSLPKIQPSRRMSLMKDTKPNFDKLSNSLGAKNTMTRRIIQDSPVKKSSTVNVTYAVEDIFQSVEPTPPPSSSSSASLTGPHANSLLACLDDTLKFENIKGCN
ncbi:hypothetical protein HELRODRAFT_170091 [Helobdella robusta]|uniref:Uncharacterized protein n=1 Tax=Helobdella robusta TaxID=6412 RepID=T1F2M1_HELRO|nr:hypothetical protein HELRODRAFT_170091 [Helobdella robusta]ESO07549.1 hypothetical protein HELRODRAFT_170091 [Helobdella robusta]